MSDEFRLKTARKCFSINDKKFIIQLFSIKGIGRKTIKRIILFLIKHELDFIKFWVNGDNIWQQLRLSEKLIKSVKKSIKEHNSISIYQKIVKNNIRVISFWEKEYPKLLLECSDFPLLLFIKGNTNCLNNKTIGVVGTRRITSYGRFVTKKIIKELVSFNFVIVSGFMYGVDIHAHLETIKNKGTTIAVLGFGFNYMYPKNHNQYVNSLIGSGGCLITEYLPEVKPNKGNFPERNRIIAGLSMGTLVIEAARKSGSHITAQCAIDEGREVFAIPGSISNPFSQGTKWLINQGAKLVTSGNDINLELY